MAIDRPSSALEADNERGTSHGHVPRSLPPTAFLPLWQIALALEADNVTIALALEADNVTVVDVNGDGQHVSIEVVSKLFEGKRSLDRQRMVYRAIWEELQGAVHAVDSLVTKTPSEV
ncbi:unnamed protein product [Closterium sp. NIES-65]|nr:unnamed protein product [Closterium sp. NIES-65]